MAWHLQGGKGLQLIVGIGRQSPGVVRDVPEDPGRPRGQRPPSVELSDASDCVEGASKPETMRADRLSIFAYPKRLYVGSENDIERNEKP